MFSRNNPHVDSILSHTMEAVATLATLALALKELYSEMESFREKLSERIPEIFKNDRLRGRKRQQVMWRG
jgi:hypothetical protein